MNNLDNLSDEELMKELKKRKLDAKNKKIQEALLIDEKIEALVPKPIDNPNIESLVKLCVEYVSDRMKSDYTNEDYPYWFKETALRAIMGKDVYEKFKTIEKLKQEKKALLK